MHYITPTCQFFLGVLVYGEAFSRTQALGFGIVWAALVIFCIESFLFFRSQNSKVGIQNRKQTGMI
jgi:chloramphenicol-sensitive protein RarD